MTAVELDFSRARMLVDNKPLAMIVCGNWLELTFEGRQRCDPAQHCSSKAPCRFHSLERQQLDFLELRIRFLTTSNVETIRRLALGDPSAGEPGLPRRAEALKRAATGYRDTRGVVHRFSVDNPDVCPHGRTIDESCERCKADEAELDAL